MEIILYDDVLPKLVCFSLSNFVKIICILFLLLPKIETIRPHVCMYTLNSDEVV